MAFNIPRAVRPEVDKAIDTDTELYNQLLPCLHCNTCVLASPWKPITRCINDFYHATLLLGNHLWLLFK